MNLRCKPDQLCRVIRRGQNTGALVMTEAFEGQGPYGPEWTVVALHPLRVVLLSGDRIVSREITVMPGTRITYPDGWLEPVRDDGNDLAEAVRNGEVAHA